MATEKNIIMRQFNGTDYDTLYPKTKAEQVEGVYTQQQILSDSTKTLYGLGSNAVPDDLFRALGAELRVTTEAGVVVTATKDDITLSATADSSGLAVLKIPTFGTWTVRATVNGKNLEVLLVVDTIAVFNISLLYIPLKDASWEFISATAEAGKAASAWSVGDKKTVKLGGVSYTAQIIGFNHDTKTAGDRAGITFQLVDCLNTKYQMNSSDTNVGGWKGSALRARMDTFLGQLDEDLQSVIKPVNKRTFAGNSTSTIETTSDKLFLLSEFEIFGSATGSHSGEGFQYDWYKAGNTKVKKVNGSADGWWERSPFNGGSGDFCNVASNGGAARVFASNPYGVSFGFCV